MKLISRLKFHWNQFWWKRIIKRPRRLCFTVNGLPVAKGRPRVVKRGKFIHTYTPPKTKEYQSLIQKEFQSKFKKFIPIPKSTPIVMNLTFFMPIPKSTSKKKLKELIGTPHLKKPDKDNLEKSVLDALNGLAYIDDSSIFSGITTKVYGLHSCVVVEIIY